MQEIQKRSPSVGSALVLRRDVRDFSRTVLRFSGYGVGVAFIYLLLHPMVVAFVATLPR